MKHILSLHNSIVCFILLLSVTWQVSAQDNKPEYKTYKRWNYQHADSLRGALRPERTCFDVTYYDLHLQINPRKQSIKGYNAIHFKVISPTARIQLDLYKNLSIDSITFQKQTLKYNREHNAIFIDFPQVLSENTLHNVEVHYQGKPTTQSTSNGPSGFHWSIDAKNRDWVGVSCEYLGASYWWPNKDHLSDEPDSMRLHYVVPKELRCIANGTLESTAPFDAKFTQYNWFIRNPINNYNVTFYLGHYIEKVLDYESKQGKHKLYVYGLDYEKENIAEYYALVPSMVAFFEAVYGEYPYWNDKFAVLQSP